jgi:DNA-binding NtrC family response regulator
MASKKRILVIEDDRPLRESIKKFLEKKGFSVRTAENLAGAVDRLKTDDYDLLLLDLTLPDGSGMEILKGYSDRYQNRIVILTGTGTIESAVAAMKKGAFDLLQKPINPDILLLALNRALEFNRTSEDYQNLKQEVSDASGFEKFILSSGKMRELILTAKKYAASDHTILITGETGTGKELLAQAVHHHSRRKKNAYLIVNCASIPENLAESELFGYKRGAFTGAHQDYPGRFLMADRGTLFLDEIAELPLSVQAKLLRVLESGEVTPLKGTRPVKSDARIITATNKVLEKEVQAGRFREDLFYRIDLLKIHIPPLRERTEDILPLAAHFIRVSNIANSKRIERIDPEAGRLLCLYPWPGNVRELKNAIFKISVTSQQNEIRPEHLPLNIRNNAPAGNGDAGDLRLDHMEKTHIRKVLAMANFNHKKAAAMLGISRSSLYRKLEEYGLRNGRAGQERNFK